MKSEIPLLLPVYMNVGRYLILAGIPFLVFYILYPHKFTAQKIQQRVARHKDLMREIRYSLQTTLLIIGIALLILQSPLASYSRMYVEWDAYPIWWIPLSIFFALIIQDAYFYWTHRLMHHKRLFKWVHIVHHKSINPTPFTSGAFNLTEAIIEAMIGPILILLLPMHFVVLLIFATLSFAYNVYGHLGYEIMPRGFRHSFLFQICNTSVHHNLHHSRFKGNYGLYFRIWDRLMGTENPAYVPTYDEIQARRFGEGKGAIASKKSMSKVMLILLFCMGTSALSFIPPSGIEGLWEDPETGAVVYMFQENGKVYGRLMSTEQPPQNPKVKLGETLLFYDFVPKGKGEYCCGKIFHPRYDLTVDGSIKLTSETELELKGTYGPISRTRRLVKQ